MGLLSYIMQRSLSVMNFHLDGNGVFPDDNVPLHLVIWKAWQRCYRVSSTSRNNVRWIAGVSEKALAMMEWPHDCPPSLCVLLPPLALPLKKWIGPAHIVGHQNPRYRFLFWQHCQSCPSALLWWSVAVWPLCPAKQNLRCAQFPVVWLQTGAKSMHN